MAACACGRSGLIRWLPRRIFASSSLKLIRGLSSTAGARDSLWQPLREVPHTDWHKRQRPVQGLQTSRTLGFFSRSTKETSPTTKSEVVENVKEEIEEVSPDKVFAVVHISGRQFKITRNDLIVINRIQTDVGESIVLQKVLLAGSENFTLIGTPLLSKEAVKVSATVIEHGRSAKVVVFKKKRRKNYKRKRGHRQDTTVLRINDIHLSSDHVQ